MNDAELFRAGGCSGECIDLGYERMDKRLDLMCLKGGFGGMERGQFRLDQELIELVLGQPCQGLLLIIR